MPRTDWPILRRLAREGERGDVPGWVLITAMTVALVMLMGGEAQRGAPGDHHRFPRRGPL